MNLLFISDIVPFPPNTGIKIRTFNIIKQLSKKFDIYLVSFNHKILITNDNDLNYAKKNLMMYCKKVYVIDIPSDLNMLTYYLCLINNMFSLKPYRVQRYWSNECINIIRRLKCEVKFDIIHYDKCELFEYSKYLKKIPSVITNHNVESKLMKSRSKYELNIFKRLFSLIQYIKTDIYERKVLNQASGYITCTEDDNEYFVNTMNIKNNYSIIENGVDISYYKSKFLEEDDYFLIIGAQSKEATANYDATIYFFDKIWPEVVKLNSNIKIKIVGRNPDINIINLSKKDHRIEVLGFVNDEREIIEKSLGLIVPLRIGGGSRLKIITAMAMGKTVISTTIGAEGINYNHQFNIFIQDNPLSFAKQLITVAFDNDLRKNIGTNAIELIKNKYDWNRIGININNFYKLIIEKYCN